MHFSVVPTHENESTSMFEKSTFTHANTECPICLEPIVEQVTTGIPIAKNITVLPCHHAMHTQCFVSCIQRSNNCPLCRQKMFTMSIDQTIVIPTSTAIRQQPRYIFVPQEPLAGTRRQHNVPLRNAPQLRAPRHPTRHRDVIEYNNDLDISVEEMLDHSNHHRSSGRVAGYIIFVIVDLSIMVMWIISIWMKQ